MAFVSSMIGARALRSLVGVLVLTFATNALPAGSNNEAVTLDVTLKLTDLDYKPLPNTTAWVVFGSDASWQSPGAGRKVITDAKGEARFSAPATLERRSKKKPTNFISSIATPAVEAAFLRVGAALEYAGFRWLYVIDIYHFPDGDNLLDASDVYTADHNGAFTRKAQHDPKGGGWLMADLKGMEMTNPGYDAWDFNLIPDASDTSGKRWKLTVAFKRSPEPVRR